MRWKDTFIAVWLVAQMLLPLSYYLRTADHPLGVYDERFAWRMFSPERMVRCQAEFRQGGRPIRLQGEFHSTWSTLVSRGRPDVVEAIAEELCGRAGGQGVTLKMVCQEGDGRRVTPYAGDRDLCREAP